MGNIFAGSEVAGLGIQIEKNGRDFYIVLAGRTKNARARKIFQYLAGEEEKHIAVFEKIMAGSEKYEPQGLDADEYLVYMNTLAGEYIFTKKNKGKQAAKTAKNDKQAVDLGIKFEKDSILFYEGIKQAVPEYDVKIVVELIRQEQNHFLQLTQLKKELR